MRLQVEIDPDGSVRVLVPEGESVTFESGSQAITQLLASVGAAGVSIQTDGPPERHRHDREGVRSGSLH